MPGEMIRMKQAYTPKYDIRNFQQPEDAALNKFNELYMGLASVLGTAPDEDGDTDVKKTDDKTAEGDNKEKTEDKKELSWGDASASETPKIDKPVVEETELSWAPDAGLSPNQTLGGEGGFSRSYVPNQDAARGLMDLRDSGKLDTEDLDWENALNMFD